MNNKYILTAALIGSIGLGALFVSNLSFAATADGTQGATSTGTADITLSVPELFALTNMGAYAFGAYSGTGNFDSNVDLCVYHNGDGSYKVTITDDSTAGAADFSVENGGATNLITYAVNWNDVTGTAGTLAVVDGTATIAQSGAHVSSPDCVGATALTANMQVVILEAALQAANADTYTAEITVVVDPD